MSAIYFITKLSFSSKVNSWENSISGSLENGTSLQLCISVWKKTILNVLIFDLIYISTSLSTRSDFRHTCPFVLLPFRKELTELHRLNWFWHEEYKMLLSMGTYDSFQKNWHWEFKEPFTQGTMNLKGLYDWWFVDL